MAPYKLFKEISFNRKPLKIKLTSKNEFIINIFDLSEVMCYASAGYLYNYYHLQIGSSKSYPPVKLFKGKYIDLIGLNMILNRARKAGAKELLSIILKETCNSTHYIMPEPVEERYCNAIIEYFQEKYSEDEYIFKRQYKVDKFKIDLCIYKKSTKNYYLVEIDEIGHSDRDPEKELERERNIFNKTGKSLIRINPEKVKSIKAAFKIDTIINS